MLKNMLLASAAAFIVLGSAASLSNMKAVITSGNGADAALTQDSYDVTARLRELQAEQVRQSTLLSVQETTIRRLQRDFAYPGKVDLSASQLEPQTDRKWSIGLDMPSLERAEQASEYHATWLQAVTLADELATAKNAHRELEHKVGERLTSAESRAAERISTLERDHGFAIARLEAEIEQRDSSIVGLMHRIVSTQSGGPAQAPMIAAKPAAASPKPNETPVMAEPDAKPDKGVMVEPEHRTDAAPDMPDSLLEGVAAYREGDYRKAFEIWRVLANAGDNRARFHLGALYFEGRGVDRDLETAHLLLGMAAEGGHERAPALRRHVAAEMAKSQVARGPEAPSH